MICRSICLGVFEIYRYRLKVWKNKVHAIIIEEWKKNIYSTTYYEFDFVLQNVTYNSVRRTAGKTASKQLDLN